LPPSPATKDLFDLEPYQFQAVDFATATPNCALWIDLGLGKTAVSLTAMRQLIAEGEMRRALVLAPFRVARKGWPDELAEWSHLKSVKAVRCMGDAEHRLRGLKTEANIHLMNFQNLPWLLKLFYRVERKGNKTHVTQLRKVPWDMIVIDEATNMQDSQGSWFKCVKYLRRGVKRMIQLTGDSNPQGNYLGLWSQMYLLDGGQRLGPTIGQYRKAHYTYDKGAERYDLNETSTARIQRAVADIALVQREADHLKHLPPYPEPEFIRVDLTPPQMKKYKEMQRKFVMEIAGQQITAVNAGVVWGKLLQLANGSVWVDDKQWLPFHEQKFGVLESYLKARRGPVLLIYSYRPDWFRIEPLLTRLRLKWRLLDSEKDEDDFNDDKLDVLGMHPMSGGHGLNIHYGSAKDLCWFGLTPSADRYKQTNARLFGGRRRLKKPDGRITHIVANGTQDLVVVDKIKTNTFNAEVMKEALVQLRKELR
jgi:hypothetical protein